MSFVQTMDDRDDGGDYEKKSYATRRRRLAQIVFVCTANQDQHQPPSTDGRTDKHSPLRRVAPPWPAGTRSLAGIASVPSASRVGRVAGIARMQNQIRSGAPRHRRGADGGRRDGCQASSWSGWASVGLGSRTVTRDCDPRLYPALCLHSPSPSPSSLAGRIRPAGCSATSQTSHGALALRLLLQLSAARPDRQAKRGRCGFGVSVSRPVLGVGTRVGL